MTKLPDSWTTSGRKPATRKSNLDTDSSLAKRANKRTAWVISDRSWEVKGERKFSDSKDAYVVRLPKGKKRYECSCYNTQHGETRRRKMCSHVLKVVMARRGDSEFAEGGKDSGPETSGTVADPIPPSLFGRDFIDIATVSAHIAGNGATVEANVDTEVDEVDEVDNDEPKRGNSRRTKQKQTEATGSTNKDTEAQGKSADIRWGGGELPSDPPPVNHPMFGKPPIPTKFTEFRPNQWTAIKEIYEALGKGVKVVFLDAPTGSGKTLIGATVPRLHEQRFNVPYICTTKSLQAQILDDFDYGKIIKGRANYPTLRRPDLTTEDCNGSWSEGVDSCDWCPNMHSCTYQVAKDEAAAAPLGILNMAYYLAETGTPKSKFRDRQLVVIDEADTLEEQLMGWIEVRISPRMRKSIGVKTLPKKTVASDWKRWLDEDVLPALKRKHKELTSQTSMFDVNIQEQREARSVERLIQKVGTILNPHNKVDIEDGWVLTGYESAKSLDNATLIFKPVKIGELAHDYLWRKGQQFLLMSATTISAQQEADNLGLKRGEWAYVEMDSTFPVESRPNIVKRVAAVSAKTKGVAYPKLAEEVDAIAEENPGARILIHTVSYELTKYLYDHSSTNRTMTYWSAHERDRALENFLNRDDAILLAPSFERGIDLPGEHCQVIVIAKVPYPYLGDKQVQARMYSRGGKVWYAVQTIRSIVQMTGRGMRSKDDWCDTYILDTNFNRLYRDHKTLFPKWWRDAVVQETRSPKARRLLKASEDRRAKRADDAESAAMSDAEWVQW